MVSVEEIQKKINLMSPPKVNHSWLLSSYRRPTRRPFLRLTLPRCIVTLVLFYGCTFYTSFVFLSVFISNSLLLTNTNATMTNTYPIHHVESDGRSMPVVATMDNPPPKRPLATIAYGTMYPKSLSISFYRYTWLIEYLMCVFSPSSSLAVSLTGCNSHLLGDGPAILKHSIHLSSFPYHFQSLFAYQMFAFIHPAAMACSDIFHTLGYTIQITDTPVNVSDIRGDFLREHVVHSGCCGEKEYIKLYSYTLVKYPIVVHLDLDSLVLQPLDDLFHAMLFPSPHENTTTKDPHPISPPVVMFHKPLPESHQLQAYFTRDYNMVHLNHPHVGVQGGFLVVKPSLVAFEEYKQIILQGDFVNGVGWKGKYGGYFGAQQIQGICSYFYDGLHPGTGVELNRCIYNSMADSPYQKDKDGIHKCIDGKDTCEDCRNTSISKIKSVHFTLCQKPWLCPSETFDKHLCQEFHKEWFRIRYDFDQSRGVYGTNIGDHYRDVYKGYCTTSGGSGYIPLTVR